MKKSYQNINRTRYLKWVFAVVCIVFPFIRSYAQVTVEMKLDTADIYVGQQVNLSTVVSADIKQQVEFPSYKVGEEMMKGLEVIRQSQIDTTYLNNNKRIQLNCTYTVTAFDSALFSIPPMAVIVDADTFRANSPVGLKVNTIPVDTAHLDRFAGPHTVVPDTFVWNNRLLLLSISLWGVLIFIVIIAIKLTCRKPLTTRKVIKAQTPPYKQAMTSIKALDIKTIKEKYDCKSFFISLTDAMRIYLQRRFGVYAMEKTTDEIVQEMSKVVGEQEISDLKTVFEQADLVKFANLMPSIFEISRCHNLAKHFLDMTKDEAQEHPEPKVEIIVLNDGMQRKFRFMLWSCLSLLLIGGLVSTYLISRNICQTFF